MKNINEIEMKCMLMLSILLSKSSTTYVSVISSFYYNFLDKLKLRFLLMTYKINLWGLDVRIVYLLMTSF